MTDGDSTEPDPEMTRMMLRANSEERGPHDGRADVLVQIPQNQLEIWDKEAEDRGMNRSSIIRAFATVGRRFIDEYNPNKAESTEQDGIENVVKNHVPVQKENAESIEEITGAVTEEVKEKVWDVLIEDESVNRTGNKFYKQ